jgi:succinate-semialdehyde dehydrogenase / glutarate-semialdehyde dehydrogenase
MGKPKA